MIISDVEGVLDNEKKLIPEINSSMANKLIEQKIISGGMIPKTETALTAIDGGVRAVVIIDGRVQNAVLLELFTDHGAGSLIRKK